MRAARRETASRVVWVLGGVLAVTPFLAAETGVVDVCAAAKRATSGKRTTVLVRGAGQVMDDGLTLASTSCPIAKTSYDQLPTVILVNVTSFATPEARSRFIRAESAKGRGSPLLDVEARGILNCRARMRFIRSGQDIVGANGFGAFGLYKCSLDSAELVHIVNANVQPEPNLPPKPK